MYQGLETVRKWILIQLHVYADIFSLGLRVNSWTGGAKVQKSNGTGGVIENLELSNSVFVS